MLLIYISTEQQRVLFHGTKLNVLVLKLGQKKWIFIKHTGVLKAHQTL